MFQQLFNKPMPRNENALTMLRDKELRRGTTVWTADGHDIGYPFAFTTARMR